MQCPSCALYHPSRYQTCVSCGTKLVADGELISQAAQSAQPVQPPPQQQQQQAPSTTRGDMPPRRGMPIGVGIAIAGFIMCAAAGGTFFFLTKPPENERLLQQGQKELQLGQYAFAVKTLGEAVKVRPNDAKALLALARAYVGVDQVDKASDCIAQAQQLGAGIMADPELASELAAYYRQHNQYDKAVSLLRPLASGNVAGKKAELADLDAAWGDEAVRTGNYKQAMQCWEEVKDLHDGTRFTEAETRLSTIYQKIGDEMNAKGDAEEALKYYAKLNVSAPSSSSYERTAELYEKQGRLELAIDQLRRAIKLSGDNPMLPRKLAALMVKRGKELLDSGDADAGYGFLQEAQSMDPHAKAPVATVRNVHMDVNGTEGSVHIAGEAWNPGPEALNALTLRAELFDSKAGKVLWTKDQRVIDEFVPPLPAREARAFDMTAQADFDPKSSEVRVYLNGGLYKTYPLSKRPAGGSSLLATPSTGRDTTPSTSPGLTLRPRLAPVTTPIDPNTGNALPKEAPSAVTEKSAYPPIAPTPGTTPPPQSGSGGTAEEKTLKDLE